MTPAIQTGKRSIKIRAITYGVVDVRAMGGGRERLILSDPETKWLYVVDRDPGGRYGPIQPANRLRHSSDPGADPAPTLPFPEPVERTEPGRWKRRRHHARP